MKSTFTLIQKAGVFFVLALMASGCATNISQDHYSDETVGEASKVYKGVIVDVRKVRVGPDQLGKSRTGAAMGAVGGAIAGRAIGGRGAAGILIGGVAGAIGGAYAEKALKTQDALEYTIELANGDGMSVVQGTDKPLSVGQNVRVIVSSRGRSRIIALR
jgi:outer membrane lipoprotein SlyB